MEIIEVIGVPFFKNGSGIHIKKENRGKFTDYCNGKVTQECIDKAKRSGNKKLIKRAVFAENSRKWKHQKGGTLVPKHQKPAGPLKKGNPAFYITFNRDIKTDSKFSSKAAEAAGIKHSGFVYIKEDGTPVFKEFGIKNANSYWGNRVDLSNAPKYQQGQDPKNYINQIYQYLGNVSKDASAEVIVVPNTDSNRIEQYINRINDSRYQTNNICGDTLNCASVAYRTLIAGNLDNSTEEGWDAWWDKVHTRIIPDGTQYADRLKNRGYDYFTVNKINQQLEDKTRTEGLQKLRQQRTAKADFTNIQDKNWWMPLSLILKNGHTCIYNGTRCYYPNHALAKNESLINDPEKHGWREIDLSELKPGDAIILHNSKGQPVHFTIFDGITPENTKPYYYMNDASRKTNAKGLQPRMVQPGDTLLIYSPGTPGGSPIRHKAPLFRFDKLYNTGGDYEGPRKYYRATGTFKD